MVIEKNPLLLRADDMQAMMPYWTMVDHIVDGVKAIKEAGIEYLPKFPQESDKDYKFRLQLGKFTNVYRDVLEGLAAKPFEDEVSIVSKDVPDFFTDFVEDVDGFGNNLTAFSSQTFFNGINYALDWIFIDFPHFEGVSMSVAEAKNKNIKPFWTHVLATNVYEVRTSTTGSLREISYIRVFEPSGNQTDPNHVRVFEKIDGKVVWNLWKEIPNQAKKEDQVVKVGSGVLSIPVIPFVPFCTGRRQGNTFKIAPPLKDAAELQITLYQNETGLEYIKAMAGYPMLAANGMKPAMNPDGKTPKEVSIGPMRILYGVPDGAGNNGEWKFIEPTANSMEFLKKDISSTKQDLRELGRQPLTALSTQLTTTTTAIAAGKAKSAVTAWAYGLKDALENALKITAVYMNIKYEPEVNVHTGFDNVKDDGSDLDTLNGARERGDLSQSTYWHELKRRKVLSPEFNAEDESKKLFDEIPSEEPDISSDNLTQSDSDDEDATIG